MNFNSVLIIAECLLGFVAALLGSLMITPFVQSLAEDWDFVDRPDGGRKAHGRAVALGGGVAVLVSALLAAGLAFAAATTRGNNLIEPSPARVEHIPEDLTASTREGNLLQQSPVYFGLLAAAILICVVGLVDDFVGLKGRYKLLGQVAASLIVVASGLTIHKVALFGGTYELGILAMPFTLFWLLGAINAINLLDGIDGLASTIGVVLSLTLAGLALFHPQSHQAEAIIALVLSGALLGFLRFNFSPATIFLGDSGSMLVGLVIGTIAIKCSVKEATTVALAVPFALWAIPILDSLAAILRRKLTGRSLFATDRGHLHHSLLVRGWSVRQAVLFIGSICATTCAGAIFSYYYENDWIAWITVLVVIVLLGLMRIFGHIEFALVRDRVRSSTRTFTKLQGAGTRQVHESRIRLQGSQEWDHLWAALTESAENYHLVRIELTLNLPALHEAFYASWKCSAASEVDSSWRLVCPLIVSGQSVGNLVVMGSSSEASAMSHIGQVADFLEPVEESLRKVITEISLAASRKKAGSPELLQDSAGAVPGEAAEDQESTQPVTQR